MTDEEKLKFAQPIVDFFYNDQESPEEFIRRVKATMSPALLNVIAGYEPWPETVAELEAKIRTS